MLVIWLLVLGMATAPVSMGGFLERLDTLSEPSLERALPSLRGAELATARLRLASVDPGYLGLAELARDDLGHVDSTGHASAFDLALAGWADALFARAARNDHLEASRRVGSAFDHFDRAIAKDAIDPWVRILRVRCLVQFPLIIPVEPRLRSDSAALRRMLSDPLSPIPATRMALAAACERLGDSAEASKLRKGIAGR